MKKIATMFLLIVAFGMVFAGATSAADVDVTVVDQNNIPVTTASPGDNVYADITATGNGDHVSEFVLITVDPENGLQFVPTDAMMINEQGSWQGNDINDPFFYYSNSQQSWVWSIGKLWPNGIGSNDQTELIVRAIVQTNDEITVDARLYGSTGAPPAGLLDEDSYTFNKVGSDNVASANAATVPMQNTGAPITAAILGLLGIIGGTIYSRLK
jgi:hypothetical protein